MFTKIIFFSSNIFFFLTITSIILFQMTMTSCLEFYNSLLLAYFYLIWSPRQVISTLQRELLFYDANEIMPSLCLKPSISFSLISV